MNIEQNIKQTLSKIKLDKHEKILVALSGGKDSTVVAYILKKLGYNIEGFHIDLGMGEYSKKCLKAVEDLCKMLNIKLHIYNIQNEMGSSMCYIRSSVQSKKSLKNCAICGVIKKSILNKQARKLKADKIATGHHIDDESQTFLLNILKGSPELNSNTGIITKNISDKKFIPRIKPLFFILEEDIKKYSLKNKLPVVYEKCPCAIDSYRIQIRKFMKSLSDKEKQNLMKNFEQISQKVGRPRAYPETFSKKGLQGAKGVIRYCDNCGEPARGNVCRMCELLKN